MLILDDFPQCGFNLFGHNMLATISYHSDGSLVDQPSKGHRKSDTWDDLYLTEYR